MHNNEYLKKRLKNILRKQKVDNLIKNEFQIVDKYQNISEQENVNKNFNITAQKRKLIEYILKQPAKELVQNLLSEECPYIMGLWPRKETVNKLTKAINGKYFLPFIEYTFLRSILTPAHKVDSEKEAFLQPCGFIIDDITEYFDGTRPSRMELILNSNFELTIDEKNRAKKLIQKLIKNKISKYNNQPIFKPSIGRQNAKKILVIDQSYGDFSIVKGMADENTFKMMLDSAVKENPDADIIIKTHPDSIGEESGRQVCYYRNAKIGGNIYKITEPINPISMIEYADKVYVCSSQFGFEALMCGKEVHVFGMPFYANWGLTIDAQNCGRRKRTRTLEDLFYIAYILMSAYINPDANKPCEIEDAIDYLINMRNKYFKEYNIRYEQ